MPDAGDWISNQGIRLVELQKDLKIIKNLK